MSSTIDATRDAASARPSPTIRPAGADELQRIGELTHAAYSHDYADLPADYSEQLRHPERLLEDFEVFVAVDAAGGFVGTIAILRDGRDNGGRTTADELYFRLLATAPHARGRGIGAALTTFAIGLARSRGRARVVMNSGPYMVGAHALYVKLGFARVSEREGVVIVDGRELQLLTFVIDV